ncbi:MAG: IclR family transcriptional regulator [Candidatus Lutibacillus vidarii]|jgi:DNA-binding IclR family transcriptional regulator|nr:IclR family transcriptional regulator [Candidatus Lutibacillus vidarii]HON73582.1 IclR family transcriptional regulator [Dermatophilaceae bacterium]HRB99116.1 IclR family transcriptional regulator [Dermatophilaceae bacterium]
MRNTGEDRTGVQSVERAITILELLAHHGTVGVTWLAAELGVHKSTASRLVATLEQRGLVEQVEDRGKYRLGAGVLRLAGATNARLDLVQEARPVARRLAAATNETVNIVVRSGDAALYLDQISGPSTLSSYNWVGQHIPLHATSNGKVLVSELAEPELTRTLGELRSYTPATITDRGRLDAELAEVRAKGYAVAADELDLGLTAVAAPVRNAHGEIIASVSVSGPTFRFGAARQAELAPLVRAAADDVSNQLGWRPV